MKSRDYFHGMPNAATPNPSTIEEGLFNQIMGGNQQYAIANYAMIGTRSREFKNCTISLNLKINAHNFGGAPDLFFEQCTFKGTVEISHRERVIFTDCTFTDIVFLGVGIKQLIIKNCTFVKKTSCQPNGGILIFTVTESRFNKDFQLSGNLDKQCHFENNHFLTSCIFNNITSSDKIYFDHCEGKIFETKLSNIESLFLRGGKFYSMSLLNSSIKSALIISNKLIKFEINNFNSDECYIQGIDSEEFLFTPRKNLNSFLYACKSKTFTLTGNISNSSSIRISLCTFSILKVNFSINNGSLEFSECLIESYIELLNSDLKRTNIIACDMSKAKMTFKNTKISEIFAAESTFPIGVFALDLPDYPQAQLAFGQLSKAMNSIGDSVMAIEYHARELHAHYKQLSWRSRVFPFINFTKLNLWLNYISNDFGRNWARGAVFSFTLGAICFYLMTLSTNRFSFGLRFDWNWQLVPSYFRFMNPLRFFETEKIYEPIGPVQLNALSYIIDFFARVFIAYGFYQTIQAFRRYGKQ